MADSAKPKRSKKKSKGKGKARTSEGIAQVGASEQTPKRDESGSKSDNFVPYKNPFLTGQFPRVKDLLCPMSLIHSQSPKHPYSSGSPDRVRKPRILLGQTMLSPSRITSTDFVEGFFHTTQVEGELKRFEPYARKNAGKATALSRGGIFHSSKVGSQESCNWTSTAYPGYGKTGASAEPTGKIDPVSVVSISPLTKEPVKEVPASPNAGTSKKRAAVPKQEDIAPEGKIPDWTTPERNIKTTPKRDKKKISKPTEIKPFMKPSESVCYFNFNSPQNDEQGKQELEEIEKKISQLDLKPDLDQAPATNLRATDSVFYFMKPEEVSSAGEADKSTPDRKPRRRQKKKSPQEATDPDIPAVVEEASSPALKLEIDSPAGKKVCRETPPSSPANPEAMPKVEQSKTPASGSKKPRKNCNTIATNSPKTPATPKSSKKEPATPEGKDDSAEKIFPMLLDPLQLAFMESYGVLFEAAVRINQKNPFEAYLASPDKGQDYLVENLRDRNRALEGDIVFAMVKPAKSKYKSANPLAVVVGIKQAVHSRVCIGTLSPFYNKTKKFTTLIPSDNRLPKLRIHDRWLPKEFLRHPVEFQDALYASDITEWNDVRHAIGTHLRFIGMAGTASAETKALLMKYRLDVTPYPEHFSKFFPPSDFTIPPEELARREDLRQQCVFTIDPETAKDLDDAVSVEIHEDGSKTVGVHIADVTYFLQENTELDLAVSSRATTIYLVDNVYHMLPRDMCGLCSLTPGADKLTFSVFWKFSPEGDIVDTWFRRSVINSVAQLSYEQAQGVLEGRASMLPPIGNNFTEEDVETSIIEMNKIAEKLRTARVEAGALRIDQTKVSFILDHEKKTPIAFITQEQLAAHKLIEEFMLLANTSVAKLLQSKLPELAMLRRHEPPQDEYLGRVQSQIERYGIPLDISSSKTLQSSLNRLSSGGGESERAHLMVINAALAKPMTRAVYFCSGLETAEARRHYALSVDMYTHFTSPIRRYADVMVHRQLAVALDMRSADGWTADYVQKVAGNCNVQKYNAKLAGEASSELYFALFVGQQGSLITEAVVCFISPNFFEVIILSTGFQNKVYRDKIDGKVTQSSDQGSHDWAIEWTDGSLQKIDVFSVVSVELTRGKGYTLDARLLSPSELKNQQ